MTYKTQGGYITLVSVLVIGVVGLAIVVSMLSLSVGFSRASFVREQGSGSLAFANACAEQAMGEIWNADFYVGSDTMTMGQGSCVYTVTGVSVPKTITATGTVGDTVSKVIVTVDALHPYVHRASWQESL